jgi:membrane protein
MAGTRVRRSIATEYASRRRAAADWKPRLASAGLAAVLLALGVRPDLRPRKAPDRTEPLLKRLTIKQFVLELYQRISDDRVVAISAGVTFFILLAIFPATAAIVSIYGLIGGIKSINGDLSSLSSILPGGAIQILGEQIKALVAKGDKALGLGALAGLAFSIWSANAGMKSLFDALNIVLRAKETRGFFKLNAVSLLFTLGALAFVVLAIGAVVAIPLFLKTVSWSHALELVIAIARWPLIWGVLAFGIALLYRFGPGKNDIPWHWITWGSGVSALVWIVASMAFSWYAGSYGTFNKTYGSLGAGIGFMTWIWISVIVILVGDEVNEILDAARKPVKRDKAHLLAVPGAAARRTQAA